MTDVCIERLDTAPTGVLLPNEVVVNIGCMGCDAACAGTYRLQGNRVQRDEFANNVGEALELTEVAGSIQIGGHVTRYEGNCEGGCPAQDPENARFMEQTLRT